MKKLTEIQVRDVERNKEIELTYDRNKYVRAIFTQEGINFYTGDMPLFGSSRVPVEILEILTTEYRKWRGN